MDFTSIGTSKKGQQMSYLNMRYMLKTFSLLNPENVQIEVRKYE